MVAGAPVLLSDEPTAGLDRDTADSVLNVLRDSARRGRTVVVTHDPAAAAFANQHVELAAVA